MSSIPEILTFLADPAVCAQGETVTLSWTTSGATSASISGVGSVAVSGQTTLTPSETATYTLTATNLAGPATQPVTVTVAPLPLLSYAVIPSSVPYSETGSPSTVDLLVIVQNENSDPVLCTEIAFIFPVGDSASDLVTSDDVGSIVAAQTTGTPWTISLANAATGAFSAMANTGQNGLGAQQSIGFMFSNVIVNTEEGIAAITVEEFSQTPPAQTTLEVSMIPPGLAITSFNANPLAIVPGDSTTLTWATTGASTVTLTGQTSVALSGSVPVSPAAPTTPYTLTATGNARLSVSEQIIVNVVEVTITKFVATEPVINLGDSTTLNWVVNNADNAYLFPGRIAVSVPTGSMVVSPANTTDYGLKAYGYKEGSSTYQPQIVTVNGVSITSFGEGGSGRYRYIQNWLYWSTTNAIQCTLYGPLRSVSVPNSETHYYVDPKMYGNTYTLSCTGPNGSTDSKKILVGKFGGG